MGIRPVTFLAVVLLTGCGASKPTPPATYPATGKVRFISGQPFAGGIITFTSANDPRLVMEAPIADDGSFELGMMFNDQRLSGAVEGKYQVMVSSRFSPAKGVQTYTIANPVTIAANANALTIEVDPATARR